MSKQEQFKIETSNKTVWTAHMLVNTRVCACSTELGQNIPQSKESFENFKREKFKGHGKLEKVLEKSWNLKSSNMYYV